MSTNQQINQAIFDALSADTPANKPVVDALNAYTRNMMRLPFTKMPVRGFYHRILPRILCYSLEYFQRLGIPETELHGESPINAPDTMIYTWIYDNGELYYENRESLLDHADYTRRLTARVVSKYEWRFRERWRRTATRVQKENETWPTRAEVNAKVRQVFGELAAAINSIGEPCVLL